MGNSKNVSRGKKRRNMFYKKKENNSLSEKDNTSKFNSLRGAKIKSRLHSCCYDNENYNIIMNLKLLKLFLKDCFVLLNVAQVILVWLTSFHLEWDMHIS